MSKVGDSRLQEVALVFLGIDFVFPHDLEDSPKVFNLFLLILAVDSQVINVDDSAIFQDWLEYDVHNSLEGSWGSFEAKRHDLELVESSCNSWYGKCGLLLVFFCDSDLVISACQVNY